jgi:glucose/arabinose dehydrogenase
MMKIEHKLKGLSACLLSAVMLSACLEPQVAPDLPQRVSSDFTVTTLVEGLEKPWSVAELPDGSHFITEKFGKIWHAVDGTKSTLFWDERVIGPEYAPQDLFSEGQGGLLDVVLAEDFATTNEVYVSYSYGTNEANGTALVRAYFDKTTLVNPTVIFRASPPKSAAQHFGGKIAFLPDDSLVLTLGDGFAYREDAQKADTHLGKLVRLTRDGGVPSDNPLIGQDKDGRSFKPQIFSLGHRNVQGLAVDSETGTLWEHEHGPRGGDELNRIVAGANYGWPLATKGRDYQGARISPYETFEGMVDPVHGWTPSIAPAGLAIYRGDMFPDWKGDALVGGLASRDLRRVDLENGVSVGEEDLLSDLNARIRDVRVAGDGAILVLVESRDVDGDGKLDQNSGQLLRITPKP